MVDTLIAVIAGLGLVIIAMGLRDTFRRPRKPPNVAPYTVPFYACDRCGVVRLDHWAQERGQGRAMPEVWRCDVVTGDDAFGPMGAATQETCGGLMEYKGRILTPAAVAYQDSRGGT